jgi:enamine deaminase RidA (YjgF/YER057c/UK114 family)
MENKMQFDPVMINPTECGSHSGFSHGVKVQTGSMLFVAGQVGWDEQCRIVAADFTAQFEKALSNVLAVVRDAGGNPTNVVRLTIYVTDRCEYQTSLRSVGETYRRLMGKHYPAMTLVEVKGLFEEGAKLELEATAVI